MPNINLNDINSERVMEDKGIIFMLKFSETLSECETPKNEIIRAPLVHLYKLTQKEINNLPEKERIKLKSTKSKGIFELSITLFVPKSLKDLGPKDILPCLDLSDADGQKKDKKNYMHFMYNITPGEKQDILDLNRRGFLIKYRPCNTSHEKQKMTIHYFQILYSLKLTNPIDELAFETIFLDVDDGDDTTNGQKTKRGTVTVASTTGVGTNNKAK